MRGPGLQSRRQFILSMVLCLIEWGSQEPSSGYVRQQKLSSASSQGSEASPCPPRLLHGCAWSPVRRPQEPQGTAAPGVFPVLSTRPLVCLHHVPGRRRLYCYVQSRAFLLFTCLTLSEKSHERLELYCKLIDSGLLCPPHSEWVRLWLTLKYLRKDTLKTQTQAFLLILSNVFQFFAMLFLQKDKKTSLADTNCRKASIFKTLISTWLGLFFFYELWRKGFFLTKQF